MGSLQERKGNNNLKYVANHKFSRYILGAVGGAMVGWLYWEFIGCNGGTCPLTSSSTKTIILFTLMGFWMAYRK